MINVVLSDGKPGHQIPTVAVLWFFVVTFAITWCLLGIYIMAPDWARTSFGEISGTHPVFFLGTWAPAISAVCLVLAYAGLSGVKGLLSRLLLWRCSPGWVAFIFVGLPLVFIVGSFLKDGPVLTPFPAEGVGALITVLFLMATLGPIEEFGWRGLAQPILQRHLAPIWAGAVIGAVWGVWHLPAFFLAGTVFGSWDFLPFFIGNITLAIIVTPLFNHTRGSLLWPMLFHWQLINPFWPDAQPYDTWLLIGVAALIVWWNRDMLFSREGAVTDVIPNRSVAADGSISSRGR